MSEILWTRHSNLLGLDTTVNIILPDSVSEATPLCSEWQPMIVYLLHGLGGGASQWRRFTALEYDATKYQAVFVSADAGRDFYRNARLAYEDFWCKELREWIVETFRFNQDIQENLIGISMGGYGALRFAAMYPDQYDAVVAISAALDRQLIVDGTDNESFLFPNEKVCSPYPEEAKIESVINCQEKLPRSLLLCGEDDPFLASNKRFMDFAEKKDLRTEAFYEPGDHDWIYWQKALRRALKFLRNEDYLSLDY